MQARGLVPLDAGMQLAQFGHYKNSFPLRQGVYERLSGVVLAMYGTSRHERKFVRVGYLDMASIEKLY